MELRESIESINIRLKNEFGVELSYGGQPRYRVVFSEDQFEKRLTYFTDEGFELIQPEVRLLPKYRQYIREKYILEALLPVPERDNDLTTKMSYEPLWVFQDKNGNYLPPFFDGCKFVIETRFDSMGKAGNFKKYKDETATKEARMAQIEKMEQELFGNESDVTDALHYGSGIVVPGPGKITLH